MKTDILYLKNPLRLRGHITLKVVSDKDTVVVVTEHKTEYLDGAIFTELIPLIDGQRNMAELARLLSGTYKKFEVIQGILVMKTRGYLALNSAPQLETPEAFWESASITTSGKAQATVRIECKERGLAEQMADSLHSIGIECSGKDAALMVLMVEDYLEPEVKDLCSSADSPVLLLKPKGLQSWMGPFLIPNQTGCWECLAHRLRHNRQAQLLLSKESEGRPAQVSLASSSAAAIHLAATQVGNWFSSGDNHALENALISIDNQSGETQRHVVVRRPQCPTCGTTTTLESSPIVLESHRRTGTGKIGHRMMTAEKMIETFDYHISPITGISPSLEEITSDGITHVFRAGGCSPNLAGSWQSLIQKRRNNASGKGVNAIESKASALGEVLERYSSQSDGMEEVETWNYRELEGDAIHPNSIMLFSDTQLANYKTINRESMDSFKRRVSPPLDESQPIDWLKAWSLTNQKWRYVAAGIACYGYQEKGTRKYCIGDSNGNAAGTCLEDAILQGFLELVERDSVALWWYNRLPKAAVSLEGIDDHYIQSLRTYYSSIEREFWVLDLTSDLGIPACVAVSRRVDEGPDQAVMGFGAHLDYRLAVLRAVTEMNQLMPNNLRRAERPDRQMPEEGDPQTSLDIDLADHRYILPDPNQDEIRYSKNVFPSFDDLKEEVEYCQKKVEELGMEMLVFNLTRPDIKLPVVKVMVPGLRHFWRRLAPGRLYDLPVQMRWSESATSESDVNEIDLYG